MVPSPSKIMRHEDIDAKTSMIDSLIAEIVPMIGELDEKALCEVRAFIDGKVTAARRALAKESTRVYLRRNVGRAQSGA